jgi:4'-phosphopantetheinyl transferase EntD
LDVEENLPLPQGVISLVLGPRDQVLQSEPQTSIVCWDRLLFCVKESVFKAWYGITKLWLDFHECSIEWLPTTGLRSIGDGVYSGAFEAKLDRFYTVAGFSRNTFQGRFVFNNKHLASLVVVDLDR